MISQDQEGVPIETIPCCSAWKDIRKHIAWYAFVEHPDMLCMPSIANGWRVNYCPSCGAETRDSVWRTQ